jgi:hypothetical protein
MVVYTVGFGVDVRARDHKAMRRRSGDRQPIGAVFFRLRNGSVSLLSKRTRFVRNYRLGHCDEVFVFHDHFIPIVPLSLRHCHRLGGPLCDRQRFIHVPDTITGTHTTTPNGTGLVGQTVFNVLGVTCMLSHTHGHLVPQTYVAQHEGHLPIVSYFGFHRAQTRPPTARS